jgi:hypothetical protein
VSCKSFSAKGFSRGSSKTLFHQGRAFPFVLSLSKHSDISKME